MHKKGDKSHFFAWVLLLNIVCLLTVKKKKIICEENTYGRNDTSRNRQRRTRI